MHACWAWSLVPPTAGGVSRAWGFLPLCPTSESGARPGRCGLMPVEPSYLPPRVSLGSCGHPRLSFQPSPSPSRLPAQAPATLNKPKVPKPGVRRWAVPFGMPSLPACSAHLPWFTPAHPGCKPSMDSVCKHSLTSCPPPRVGSDACPLALRPWGPPAGLESPEGKGSVFLSLLCALLAGTRQAHSKGMVNVKDQLIGVLKSPRSLNLPPSFTPRLSSSKTPPQNGY